VDARVGLIRVVLDVLLELARLRDREDVAIAGVLVEGVSIDGVRRLLGREEKDGPGVCVWAVGLGCEAGQVSLDFSTSSNGIVDWNGWNARSPPMGCDASWTISVGLRTAKLDHFFMAAP
jgi:hypothetical protein